MKNKKTVAIVALISLVMFTAQTANAAEVRKISPEVLLDGYSNRVWSVSVVCAEIDDARFIERVGDSGKWCARDLPTACSNKKVKAAKKVCGTHFERSVAKYKASQSDAVDEDMIEVARAEVIEAKVVNETQSITPAVTAVDVDVDLETQVNEAQVDSAEAEERIALTEEMLEIEEEKIRLQKKKLELKLMKLELEKQTQG